MGKTNHRAKKVEGLIGIVGIPGKGKSYFLQKLALQYKAKGYIVVLGNCQWTLEGAIHFDTEEELLGIYLDPVNYNERLAVFVDEAQALWPSREWSKTKKDIRDWFAMFRHGGVVAFYYTTQSLGDIELMIRAKPNSFGHAAIFGDLDYSTILCMLRLNLRNKIMDRL